MKHRFLFVFTLLLSFITMMDATAQAKVRLLGMVTGSKGEPMSMATVSVEGTSLLTFTDDEGKFTLELPTGERTIVVSYQGYETQRQTISLNKEQTLYFVMKESAYILESVVVYGKTNMQKTRESAFSVNALDVKPIVNSLSNINTMINRTTGIRIREEGGVGSDFDLSINGLSGNSVRYFIDGIPLDTKGSGVNLGNLPVNIIERVEIYKGVVPATLGTDALGGAVNIITNRSNKNYLDASYGYGSFHTHIADVNGQVVEPKSGMIFRMSLGLNYSKNDYMMRGVEVWDEENRKYINADRRRFHDDYFSLFGQFEAGVRDKKWAGVFFISGSYSKVDKEIQTGSIQTKVIGMAEKNSQAWNISANYLKQLGKFQARAFISHTWDASVTVDTACRIYNWDGTYTPASRNEITGRAPSIRHYVRPLTVLRTSFDYAFNQHHSLNLNYLLNRTGNRRYDDVDEAFAPTNDELAKHIIGLTYGQKFFNGRMENSFFIKDYINATSIEQSDLSHITGAGEIDTDATKGYWGGGAGSRFTIWEQLSVKASYERSIRLPLSRELLGNGTTIYPNLTLKPENSHNVNFGLFGTWEMGKGHSLVYEANGFLRYVDDYIQATVSEKEGMMQYENIPAVHIKGVEGELRYYWKDNLQIMGNVSYYDARDQKKYKTDGKPSATYNNRVPNRPWLYSNAEASYQFHDLIFRNDRLRISYSWQWIHWFFLTWEAYGAVESKSRIPTQNVSDVGITYSWDNERYNISFECRNIFDETVYDNYMLQKPGRSFLVKFRLFLN